MGEVQHGCRFRDTARGQEDIEHVKLMKVQVGIITLWNSVYGAACIEVLIWRAQYK